MSASGSDSSGSGSKSSSDSESGSGSGSRSTSGSNSKSIELGDVVAEDKIPPSFSHGIDDQDLPQRRLTDFVVTKGDDEMVSICALDDLKLLGDAKLAAKGTLESKDSELLQVEIGPLREWCIEYSAAPVLWVRTDKAWYNMRSPAAEYAEIHKLARTRFEICSRVYLLCTTLDPKQTTYKNVLKLLSQPFNAMQSYEEVDVLKEGDFILDQAQSLNVPRISTSGFIKGLKDRLKREAVSVGVWSPPENMSREMDSKLRRRAGRILANLMKHKFAWPFLQPVDPVEQNCPDYLEVVKTPMDLGTVSTAYSKNMYTSTKDLVKDVRLVWNNCRAYNSEDTDLHKYVVVLEKLFETQLIAATFEESKAEAARIKSGKSSGAAEKKKKDMAKVVKKESVTKDPTKPLPKAAAKAKRVKKQAGEDSVDQGSIASQQSKKSEDELILPEVDEDVEYDESRTCSNGACERNARVGSIYCSDRCGLQVAYGRLRALKGKEDKRKTLAHALKARALGMDIHDYLRAIGLLH
mmetsp:Transcript_6432/g.19477  ORF Transcript_6432/g.19477 Transcript_6432/m.19477 type:complete len:523 (-) Transcript_6432:1167-2735(-)|eukprot:CAMPEP_0198732962 /NCGR_PEP_ID=MMETSP1475-20131203/41428_1 /TAXON_ID= ORGANISM="Unidentified sp., Strain CCMP1999" /NCGR_SAMPLE_ID=MMETSP1475 /ASSEMBLY_ACC=CAM_ASM_001111 /LENGTH=522 /DNA_ID=CAMNT_0044496175 /DNA_START=179 /DNA_END=1747 /DNA_ORIENTATION=+